MNQPTLYRNRLIPMESIRLDDDVILSCTEEEFITSWTTLHPRSNLAYGYSLYLPKLGFKISRFYNHENQFKYWYCDIIESTFEEKQNAWYFTDLLVDVIVKPNGFVKVLDLDELNTALNEQLITLPQLQKAIARLHNLLQVIYKGEFSALTANFMEMVDKLEKERRVNL